MMKELVTIEISPNALTQIIALTLPCASMSLVQIVGHSNKMEAHQILQEFSRDQEDKSLESTPYLSQSELLDQ